jgi:hypothetical protein
VPKILVVVEGAGFVSVEFDPTPNPPNPNVPAAPEVVVEDVAFASAASLML